MSRIILLLGNQMDVIEQLSLEIITNPTITSLAKEHFCRGQRTVVITNVISVLRRNKYNSKLSNCV